MADSAMGSRALQQPVIVALKSRVNSREVSGAFVACPLAYNTVFAVLRFVVLGVVIGVLIRGVWGVRSVGSSDGMYGACGVGSSGTEWIRSIEIVPVNC